VVVVWVVVIRAVVDELVVIADGEKGTTSSSSSPSKGFGIGSSSSSR
jgi:hypothetical protein